MRGAVFLSVALALGTVSSSGQRAENTTLHLSAWSDTAGPYGKTWHMELNRDGSATVTAYSGPGSKTADRRFTVPLERRVAMIRAAEEAGFFALPDWIGPSSIPLHGPENVLEIEVDGKMHKVFLYDPVSAKGVDASRFQRVWRAVVSSSPVKPPL